MTKLYSYVLREDTGFAPNPYHGFCTLACCKGPIRMRAEVGDWIIGTGSDARGKWRGNYISYAMLSMEPATVASQNDGLIGLYRNSTEGFPIRLSDGWLGQ